MNRFMLIVVALLLLATPALATNSGMTYCGIASYTETTADRVVKGNQCIAWRFDGAEDSPVITFQGIGGLICFDPHTGDEGVSGAEIDLRYCPSGAKAAADPEFTCFKINDATLDGTTGASATQNSCLRVGPGAYWSDVGTTAGGDDAVVYFSGESE